MEFFYLCMKEKKNNFESTVIISRYIRIVNHFFEKGFKVAERLTKTSFFLYFRDCPQCGKKIQTKETWKVYAQE